MIYKPQPKLSSLIEKYKFYPSRNRVMHSVKSAQRYGQTLHLTLDCGMRITVKDSKRGRGARWLKQMVYWSECKRCSFVERPSRACPPREKLKIAPEKKYSRRELRLGNFDVRSITHD